MSRVAIVDYGTGNLRSVSQAVHAVAGTADVLVTGDARAIAAADRVIFPGQGAMGDCMRHLEKSGLRTVVEEALRTKPVLAICIGMTIISLLDKRPQGNALDYGQLEKPASSVVILWVLLILVMIALYTFFNGH